MKKKSFIILWVFAGMTLLTSFSHQVDFAALLQKKLDLYYQRHIPAKIHLTFNQPKYSPGDTAYYKLDFFTADTFHPIGGRQIINVNLIDANGGLIQQAKVLVRDGVGFNQIPLPKNALPGRYTVVAFNEVMKEYDDALVFQAPLWIAGPMLFGDDGVNTAVQFYPEGGHLIAGIANKIVVKGPPNSSGSIFSEETGEVASLSLNSQGLGFFFLTPRKGVRYFASLPGNVKVHLPNAADDGVGILVSVPANRSPIRVTVQRPELTLKSENLIFAVSSQGSVYYTADLSFNERNFLAFAIPQNRIREGIARLTIFKEDGQAIADRMVFIPRYDYPVVKIKLDNGDFSTREEIPLTISVRSQQGEPMPSSFAVTVYQNDLLRVEGETGNNILHNVLLFGDLPGSLNTAEGFSLDQPSDLAALDNFLITQQWNRFTWEDIWKEKAPSIPFRNYLHLAGKAFMSDGKPLPDSTMITFFLQKSVMTYEIYVDQSGGFDFPLLMDFFGDEEVFYKAERRGKELTNLQIALDPPFNLSGQIARVKEVDISDYFAAFSRQRKFIDQSYSYHLVNRTHENAPSLNAMIEEEVLGVDVVVNLNEYLLFPTMSETLREIIPMLQHRKNKGRDIVSLFFDDRNRFAEGEPMFIIDGVITDNTTYFLSLKPADVASIKIINSFTKLQAFGAIGKNGMVLIETKIPGHAEKVPRSDHNFQAQGLAAPSGGHKLKPGKKDLHVPDLRTNLYWNPEVKTDTSGNATVSVTASDVTGNFRIVVEGFTSNGKPFFTEENFQVSFKSH